MYFPKDSIPGQVTDLSDRMYFIFQYIGMIDTDEIIMPQKHGDWHEMLQWLDENDNVSKEFDAISFHHVYFFGNHSESLLKSENEELLDKVKPNLYGLPLKLQQDFRAREIFSEGFGFSVLVNITCISL